MDQINQGEGSKLGNFTKRVGNQTRKVGVIYKKRLVIYKNTSLKT